MHIILLRVVCGLSDMMASDNSTLKDVQQVVSQVNSKVEQQYTTIYTYIDSSMANLQIDTDKIVSEVLQQSVAKSEYETFASTVRNILQMEADGTTIIFQTILEEIARVEGVESTHYAELLTHIRFSADGVEIGRTGSAITMRLDNERLGFYNNGTLVAYISDNQLYITDGHFLNSLRIGKYAFVPEDNGSTSFVYMEE